MVMVFPSTKRTSDISKKKIVLMSVRSIVHPKTLNPPGLDCKYVTAKEKGGGGGSVNFMVIPRKK
jgi:hypothetical protein